MGFRKIERKWQKKWQEEGVFEARLKEEKPKFFITVAYPYPSGKFHIGAARTYILTDFIARWRRMQGFNVLFPMAWHITGTPIVGAFKRFQEKEEKQLRILNKVFKLSTEQLKQIRSPTDYAKLFIKDYKEGFKSLGFSIDWRREFTTNDKNYKRFIEWQFRKLKKRRLLKWGLKSVKWCVKEKNPVTQHDLLKGEEEEIFDFTLLKLKFNDSFLVAATRRPETAFGQTNLWVNPSIEYIKAKVNGELWIVSKECFEKLKHQKKKIERIGKIQGSDLIGKKCVAPGVEKKIPILPANFCNPDLGTGIVTSVPSDAPWDWIALQELKKDEKLCKQYGLDRKKIKQIKPIPIISIEKLGDFSAEMICKQMGIKSQIERERIEEATELVYRKGYHSGRMKKICGKFGGMEVKEAQDKVRDWLIERNEADGMIDLSGTVICRCGGKVIARKAESWFIDYCKKGWKSKAKECLTRTKIIPKHSRKQYLETIDWLREWPCVRHYGLGTKLPFDKDFVIEPLSDSTIYPSFYTIAHLLKEFEPQELSERLFNNVFLGKGRGKEKWKSMRKNFKYWYPVDLRCSARDLISNHLTFYLFQHSELFCRKNWPRGIATWGMGLLEGEKMSSSKGNVLLLEDAIKRWGADVCRFSLLALSEPWEDFDWREREVEKYKKHLEKFWNLVLELLKKAEEGKPVGADVALLSKMQLVIERTSKMVEQIESRKALQECFFRPIRLIKWYRRRISKPNKNVIEKFLLDWVRLLTPFIPHLAEEIWNKLGKKGFISLASWPKKKTKLIDKKAEFNEDLLKRILEDIKSIRNVTKMKPARIFIYVADEWKFKIFKAIAKRKEREMSKLMAELLKDKEIKSKGRKAIKLLQQLLKEKVPEVQLNAEQQLKALQSSKEFLESESSAKVKIFLAEDKKRYDPHKKAVRANPLKPAIYLE